MAKKKMTVLDFKKFKQEGRKFTYVTAYDYTMASIINESETVSIMINEEDHVREQYFLKGFELRKVYERISGIDDIISESIPFAFDPEFGYLTACPTNLGTGLRASVMMFLPALTRCDLIRKTLPTLTRLGLTVRGQYGEGSGAEGEMYQISNEVTLGRSEEEILSEVEDAVRTITEFELREREKMLCADEIGFFVRAVADGSASDAQIAAFCMALLVMPSLVVSTRSSVESLPPALYFTGAALGLTEGQILRRLLVPAAARGILGGLMLAMGRAAEDTAVIMLTGVVVNSGMPAGLGAKFEALPFLIYYTAAQYMDESELLRGFGAALVLLMLSALLMGAAWLCQRSMERRWKGIR